MSNVEDIITTMDKKQPRYTSQLSKDAWIKEQQTKRSKAYDMINNMADSIVKNKDKFQTYLNIQSKFDRYSVGNCLLIAAQKPDATQLKTYSDWRSLGAIYRNHTNILILEPGQEYIRKDGSTATYFNPKELIDISDTSVKQKERTINYDDSIKLAALLTECPVDVKAVDNIGDTDKLADWNKEDKVLYVKRNDNVKETFKALCKELAQATLEETGNLELDDFKSECISYMICNKHNIEYSSEELKNIPNALQNMETSQIRNELNSMKNIMDDINSRMNLHFERISKVQEKVQKNKDQTR